MKIKSINYIGPSMNPLLKAGDALRIIPYDGKEIRRGDVIVFTHPENGPKIVHRVVSVDPQGIRTRGDNNRDTDPWILSPDRIVGRVVWTQSENRRLHIYGGTVGGLFAAAVRVIHLIDSGISTLLRPAYYRLARAGFFRGWVPRRLKLRIFSFHRPGGTELQLLLGRHVIGKLRHGRTQWRIRRPFRLFVDEASLPGNPSGLKPLIPKK